MQHHLSVEKQYLCIVQSHELGVQVFGPLGLLPARPRLVGRLLAFERRSAAGHAYHDRLLLHLRLHLLDVLAILRADHLQDYAIISLLISRDSVMCSCLSQFYFQYSISHSPDPAEPVGAATVPAMDPCPARFCRAPRHTGRTPCCTCRL